MNWVCAHCKSEVEDDRMYCDVCERPKRPERIAELEALVTKLTRAVDVLYWGSPELHKVAENCFSGCASTQRENSEELRDFLRSESLKIR